MWIGSAVNLGGEYMIKHISDRRSHDQLCLRRSRVRQCTSAPIDFRVAFVLIAVY